MARIVYLVTLISALATPTLPAQTTWQFKWEKGQTHFYRANHVTQVEEIVEGNRVASSSKVQVVKRWHVVDVDAQGIALLEMSIVGMRNEQKKPNGDVQLFDSSDIEKSTPGMREMSKFLGKPLASLRMDIQGRIVEVKLGSEAKYEADPPFAVIFPGKVAPAEGQVWRRPYEITLEPPQGNGEKFKAEQIYTVKQLTPTQATLGMTTVMKTLPATAAEKLPLLQKEAQGQIVVDLQAGQVISIQVAVDKSVSNHQGQGSSYRFQSQFTEQRVSASDANVIIQTSGTSKSQ